MYKEPNTPMPPVDKGPLPAVIAIEEAARSNRAFRQVIWTGEHLQLTLMCIPVGEDIGTEMHTDLDQFLRIEEGVALLRLGACRSAVKDDAKLRAGTAILISAGTYHNVVNAGRTPLRLSSLYAPPTHPRGALHRTKEEALREEH